MCVCVNCRFKFHPSQLHAVLLCKLLCKPAPCSAALQAAMQASSMQCCSASQLHAVLLCKLLCKPAPCSAALQAAMQASSMQLHYHDIHTHLGVGNGIDGGVLRQTRVKVRAVQWVLVLLHCRVVKPGVQQLASIWSPPQRVVGRQHLLWWMESSHMYMDCLGCAVLLCLVCLFDLACFFLSSFSSLI